MKKKKRIGLGILIGVLAIILITAAAFFIYTGIYYKADATAMKAMKSTTQVAVDKEKGYTVFRPASQSSDTGYIFYPGGKVEAEAYAPILSALAEKGVTCFLFQMPFRLAVLDMNAADKVLNQYNGITRWYIGGHSLGGAMTANYAARHSDGLKGLILMGAYPVKDLSGTTMKLLSFYGSEDKVLNKDNFEKNKQYAPASATYFEIKGGNHGGYGNYGAQKGDGTASISAKEQQTEVINEILKWLSAD